MPFGLMFLIDLGAAINLLYGLCISNNIIIWKLNN